jgi:hypothetical protein
MLVVTKSQPTPSDVHINAALTNISIAYLQRADMFVADQVYPNVPVTKQSDYYYTYDRGMFNRDQMELRAPGTRASKVGYKTSSTTYTADVWASRVDIPDQVMQNADAVFNLDREATALLTHQMLIKRETNWVTNHFATGKWGNEVTGVAGVPGATEFRVWSDYDNSDPISDVETGMQTVGKTGFEPNTLVLDRVTWGYLKDHPAIVDRLNRGQTTGPALATMDSVAAIFGLERILVSKAVKNTAAEGATNVDAYIAGDNALLCYVTPTPGIMTPSAGYTFSWTGMAGAGPMGQRIKRYRIEEIESDVVEGQMAFDQKLVATDLGYFFLNTVA